MDAASPDLVPSPETTDAVARALGLGTVLLVEDDAVNRRVALPMLEKMGYRVEVATNGREAVDAVARSSYAAVIMDCQMPEMDGYEATMAIRQAERTHRVPIIAMTASAMRSDQDTGSSGTVGATALADAFTLLERAGKAGDLFGCHAALSNVTAELARARPVLEAERARGTSVPSPL